ncbi:signal peptide peptidase SppA [Sunxiuqinia sp. A32]|uniref:signal peptide peptidase SppA n=1 Tax=Sunxiuqinia sp. A32 TaxID=3461496 RepID=UPI004045E7F1
MKEFLKFTLATIVGVILASFLITIFSIIIFSAILSMSEQPVEVANNSMLIIRLDSKIVERSSKSPFSELDMPGFRSSKELGLDDILSSIKKAKTDNKIKGIYLNPSVITAGLATIEEIRNAIIDFKESGKFVYAYGEALSQKSYYLVSVADKIILNPKGMVELKGLSAQRTFFKNALEKIGVEMQVIRHGKFKAAVEPYILEKMSPENRLQTETYVGSIWNQVLLDISKSRGLSIDELNDLADGVTTFQEAEFLMTKGLIDTVKYKDQVIDELKEKVGISKDKDIPAIDIAKYSRVPATSSKGFVREKIAVIYASGDIDMGGADLNSIQSDKLSRTIRKARQDSAVKAIVLRINSPGGSAYGSEVIWREVKLAAETKPLVASMGDVAASGGYYIAAAADTIIADRTTITGSIGIFGVIPNAGELLNDKLGITYDVVNTNEHSDILSLNRPMNDFEKSLLQNFIERGYDTFVGRVVEGRNLTKDGFENIGEGRVWSAENAMENGLVDLYGGVDDAIKLAAQMAGISEYRTIKLPEIKDPFQEFIKELSGTARMWILEKELGSDYRIYEQLKNIKDTRGVLARMPYEVSIN